jgi:hypothetical protein
MQPRTITRTVRGLRKPVCMFLASDQSVTLQNIIQKSALTHVRYKLKGVIAEGHNLMQPRTSSRKGLWPSNVETTCLDLCWVWGEVESRVEKSERELKTKKTERASVQQRCRRVQRQCRLPVVDSSNLSEYLSSLSRNRDFASFPETSCRVPLNPFGHSFERQHEELLRFP